MRKATLADLESLVGMMTEFYAEADYALNPSRARKASRRSWSTRISARCG